MSIKIAPSVLASDFSKLGTEAVRMTESSADYLHLDVMDGVFVPNISFGAPVISSIRKCTPIFFDVHLMICDPLKYIDDFKKSGADNITFHIESTSDPESVIDYIHSVGCKASVSLKPSTDIKTVFPYLEKLDMVLVMTVEPGFGGQAFMPDMLPKIKALRQEIIRQKLNTDIQVDGGIDEQTVSLAAANGANVFVSGSTIFKSSDPHRTINCLKTLAADAFDSEL
ncbi:MAG: ribulose-phosphate 3-epimerase [Clostridia bacterium]|nr:ribulose-phosphate 3-epimerase [Clostridia bacterium]